jgi:hypothetical protein
MQLTLVVLDIGTDSMLSKKVAADRFGIDHDRLVQNCVSFLIHIVEVRLDPTLQDTFNLLRTFRLDSLCKLLICLIVLCPKAVPFLVSRQDRLLGEGAFQSSERVGLSTLSYVVVCLFIFLGNHLDLGVGLYHL